MIEGENSLQREAEEQGNKWLSSHFGLLARSATNLVHLSSQVFMAAFFSVSNKVLNLQEKRHSGQERKAEGKAEGVSDVCRAHFSPVQEQ